MPREIELLEMLGVSREVSKCFPSRFSLYSQAIFSIVFIPVLIFFSFEE